MEHLGISTTGDEPKDIPEDISSPPVLLHNLPIMRSIDSGFLKVRPGEGKIVSPPVPSTWGMDEPPFSPGRDLLPIEKNMTDIFVKDRRLSLKVQDVGVVDSHTCMRASGRRAFVCGPEMIVPGKIVAPVTMTIVVIDSQLGSALTMDIGSRNLEVFPPFGRELLRILGIQNNESARRILARETSTDISERGGQFGLKLPAASVVDCHMYMSASGKRAFICGLEITVPGENVIPVSMTIVVLDSQLGSDLITDIGSTNLEVCPPFGRELLRILGIKSERLGDQCNNLPVARETSTAIFERSGRLRRKSEAPCNVGSHVYRQASSPITFVPEIHLRNVAHSTTAATLLGSLPKEVRIMLRDRVNPVSVISFRPMRNEISHAYFSGLEEMCPLVGPPLDLLWNCQMLRLRGGSDDDDNESVIIGLFWDVENIPVPKEISTFDVVHKLKERFGAGRHSIKLTAVFDTKILQQQADDLQFEGVTVVHVKNGRKNEADEKIIGLIEDFASSKRGRREVVLISDDKDFAECVSSIRLQYGTPCTIVHTLQVSSRLLKVSTNATLWQDVLKPGSSEDEIGVVNFLYVQAEKGLTKENMITIAETLEANNAKSTVLSKNELLLRFKDEVTCLNAFQSLEASVKQGVHFQLMIPSGLENYLRIRERRRHKLGAKRPRMDFHL